MPIEPQPVFGIDPDIDLHEPAQRQELGRAHGAIVAVIALGGALGALARYGLTLAWPTPPGGFPWTVFTINVIGSALLATLMVVITEFRPAHPLLRPFLGTGVLGGFTTFSTYANDIRALLDPGTIMTAVLYLAGTLIAALTAAALAMTLTRATGRFLSEGKAR
ncbi:fluoride efflux transporter CrcB [Nocardia jejuensis]|uniref:fluoride efflux transporter CrcB n=1 Tax=Nocardia jejuensis TaxID=328049 RepID=UPI00082B02BA|nr:fluoride efflux transporter CrcB [Nocardia jejuensis]